MHNAYSIQTSGLSQKENLNRAVAELEIKRKQLEKKINALREVLDGIKQEYLARVGALYSRIDQLDRDIARYKAIAQLMHDGCTFSQAKQILEKKQEKSQHRQKSRVSNSDAHVYLFEEQKENSNTDAGTLKMLYRKLTRKFHPDLVQNAAEKKKREEAMKKINAAFAEKNLTALRRMDAEDIFLDFHKETIESLRKILVRSLELLDETKKEYMSLVKSEWNALRKKISRGKKSGEDVLRNLETVLSEEVQHKTHILNDLKKSYETE